MEASIREEEAAMLVVIPDQAIYDGLVNGRYQQLRLWMKSNGSVDQLTG